jgi:Kef-type K+ transport system membrane component KefB
VDIFIGISLIIVIAAIIAGILQRLKQPLIIGHIITGLIVGPILFQSTEFREIVDSLSHFGIALLLFIIGLSLSPKVIKEVGRVSFFTGIGQIALISTCGYFLARLIGYDAITALYLGLALTFSSTIIIMKLLSDKHELNKLHSKISIGLLLVQDLLVALLLIGITAFGGGSASPYDIVVLGLKGLFALSFVALFSIYLVPRLSVVFAKNQEFLFLFSIGWGLGFATLFHILGFSMEIGALAAGVALSSSPFHFEISTRLRPLRDFFVILFFILLGSRIDLSLFQSELVPIIIFSLFVIIVKPIMVTFLTGFQGFRRKVSFLSAVNFTQVSEFSIIVLMAGIKNGLNDSVVSLITIVSLVSITVSSYLILYGQRIFPLLQKLIFERGKTKRIKPITEEFEVILFGCNRVGLDFLRLFEDKGERFLIVDFDPETIKKLEALGLNCRYGDADDNEFLEELNLSKVKMVISTVPNFETNHFLIERIHQVNKKAVIIVISHESERAIELYEAGATYVITPNSLSGKYASMLISKYGYEKENFDDERDKHLKDLKKRTEIEVSQILPEIYR